MNCLDIHGKPTKLIFTTIDNFRPRSALHLSARQLLQSLFPVFKIFEEVNIPGSKYFLDFLIPQKRIACEVHGAQHYRYIPHFHNLPSGFTESKNRDTIKAEWCYQNGIYLAVLPFDQNLDEWRTIVTNCLNN